MNTKLTAADALAHAKATVQAEQKVEKLVERCLAKVKTAAEAGRVQVLVMAGGCTRINKLVIDGALQQIKTLGYRTWATDKGIQIRWDGGNRYSY